MSRVTYPDELKRAAVSAYRTAPRGQSIAAASSVVEGMGFPLPHPRAYRDWAYLDGERLGTPKVVATKTRVYNDALDVREDCLVLPDVHVPYHNARWINRCIALAGAMQIPSVFLPGDALDANWASAWGDSAPESLESERRAWSEDVVPALKANFRNIYWTMGNHEFRMARAIDHKVSTVEWVRNIFTRDDPQITVTEYAYGFVHGVWVGHPKASGLRAHIDISTSEDMDSVLGHTHHFHASQSPNGKFFGFQVGWCGDPKKMRYINVQAPHGKQKYVNGAAIIMREPGDARATILPIIEGVTPPEAYLRIAEMVA